jgi:hypothetical protein
MQETLEVNHGGGSHGSASMENDMADTAFYLNSQGTPKDYAASDQDSIFDTESKQDSESTLASTPNSTSANPSDSTCETQVERTSNTMSERSYAEGICHLDSSGQLGDPPISTLERVRNLNETFHLAEDEGGEE